MNVTRQQQEMVRWLRDHGFEYVTGAKEQMLNEDVVSALRFTLTSHRTVDSPCSAHGKTCKHSEVVVVKVAVHWSDNRFAGGVIRKAEGDQRVLGAGDTVQAFKAGVVRTLG